MNNNLVFTKTHEWVEFLSEDTARIGLTDFAQKELGDLVFVNLCEEGDALTKGKAFADVESVKAVSDVFAPCSAIVTKINEDLLTEPERINENPYGSWFVEVKDITDKEEFLTAEEYETFIQEGK